MFTGRIQADIVCAPANPDAKPPTTAYVVVEAKHPNETLDEAADQAFSYCYALHSPYFICSTGKELEVHRAGVYAPSERVLAFSVKELASQRGALEQLLSRASVLAYLDAASARVANSPALDLDAWLSHQAMEVAERAVDRSVRLGGASRATGLLSGLSPVARTQGQWTHVVGVGGRGKSTTLRRLVRDALSAGDGVPIFLSLQWGTGPLTERLASVLKRYVPPLGSSAAIETWLKATPTLLVLDEWDSLTPQEGKEFETTLAAIRQMSNIAVVSAGKPARAIPRQATALWELDRLTTEEVIALTGERLALDEWNAKQLLSASPSAIRDLLGEPIILDVFLTQSEGDQAASLELFAGALAKLAQSSVNAPGLSPDEIVALLQPLRTTSVFTLDEVSPGARAIGRDGTTHDLVSTLIDLGLVRRVDHNLFEFGHDAWRIYFDTVAVRRVAADARPSFIAKWIEAANADWLRLGALIFMPFATDRRVCDALLGSLMTRAPEIYLELVSDVAALVTGEPTLAEAAQGFFKLRERWFGAIGSLLPPWELGLQLPEGTDLMLSLSGTTADGWLRFVPGYRARFPDGTQFIPAGETHSFNLIHYDAHSGWFFGSKSLWSYVKELVEKRSLYCDWTAIERVRSAVMFTSNARLREYQRLTLGEFAPKLREDLEVAASVPRMRLPEDVRFGRRRQPLYLVLLHAEELVRRGFGLKKVAELGLPGYDVKPAKHSGYFPELYSPARRVERVKALLEASMAAYRQLCDAFFPVVREQFRFAGQPARGAAVVDVERSDPGTSWMRWFEACVSWSEQAAVFAEGTEPTDAKDLDAISSRIVRAAAALGRRPEISITQEGEWDDSQPVVTETAFGLLHEDLDRLFSRLERQRISSKTLQRVVPSISNG